MQQEQELYSMDDPVISAFLPDIRKRAASLRQVGIDREDLEQEGLIGLLAAIASYREDRGASFETYASRCIQNAMVSAVRAAASKKHAPLNDSLPLDDMFVGAIPSTATPEETAVRRDEVKSVFAAVQNLLSSLEREALTLRLEGFEGAALAERIGVSAKSADNALQRARKKLRRYTEDMSL